MQRPKRLAFALTLNFIWTAMPIATPVKASWWGSDTGTAPVSVSLPIGIGTMKVKSCKVQERDLERSKGGFGYAPNKAKHTPPMSIAGRASSPSASMPQAEAKSVAPLPPPRHVLPEEPRNGDRNQTAKRPDAATRESREIYLSNDDSMSLASAQRIIYAIDNFLPLYQYEIRPHELLNFFDFKTNAVAGNEAFSVRLDRDFKEQGETLAISVQGKGSSRETRLPAVITLIIDKSGSMSADGKMEYLREGMSQLKAQFKDGDVVNVVEFDHEVCNAIEGMVVGRDGWQAYDKTVSELEPRGSTDLHAGLVEGYKLADQFHNPSKLNRVLLITDAIANTGELSPELMGSITRYYDTKKIALSGIGVGLDFNDELLDTLTERGRGAYLFLGMRDAIPKVFGSKFISLLETVARDVQFKVSLPQGLNMETFYGEEASSDPSKVQPINYFANTSQLFMMDLQGRADAGASLGLQIQYRDPMSDQAVTRQFSLPLTEADKSNVAKGRLLMSFAKLLEETSLSGARPYGNWQTRWTNQYAVPSGKTQCTTRIQEMQNQAQIYSDADTGYALGLAQKYCSRFI